MALHALDGAERPQAKDWGETKRKDDSMQWTYEQHPLYYYDEDKKAGDMMGDGKGGVWHVAQ